MLKPRETDIPALFVVLIVLPILTYFLLGKWNEASKKTAKINFLAQIAAEEALKAEAMVSADVLPVFPSLKSGIYVCAKCFSPATTRCARCKSVRYCSGKCQIMHWRQGHKQECQQQKSDISNFSTGLGSNGSDIGRKFPDHLKRARAKVKRENLINEDVSFTGTINSCADARSLGLNSQLSAENFHEDTALQAKSEPGNFSNTYDVEVTPNCTKLLNTKHFASESKKAMHENKTLYKPNNPTDLPEKALHASDEIGLSSNEVSRSLAELKSLKENTLYKIPPYTLDPYKLPARTASQNSSQVTKRKCYVDTDLKTQHVPTSVSEQSYKGISNLEEITVEASRNPSKINKKNLGGLISSYKKIKVLFPYEDLVMLFECKVSGISPRGLINCGNSCYANVVLQCLTFTKPLMVYLLRRSHTRTCRVRDWCLMCELEQHTAMLLEGGGPLSPSSILLNMRNVGCRMGGGNQEDAHEFLRLLVMSMQAVCLYDQGGEKKVDSGLQETTLVQQIFGGRLKSKVKCLRCHHESERYENILDLTLEIYGWVESLEDALTQFTTPEDLDGENMYRCGRCCAYVRARKQLSLYEVPNILTIVLKRFQTGKYGKINKCVTFPDLLDMIPFVTGSADSPPFYMLYAVVVHLDTLNTSFSGHYVSYIKDTQGTWFRIDDSEVQVVPSTQVMSEGAYMLFYSRCFPRPPRAYIEKSLHQSPALKHSSSKSLKPSRNGQYKEIVAGPQLFSLRPEKDCDDYKEFSRSFLRQEESYADRVSTDFSDATSSEWSLFTSSDDSSFTTESTRDSFSATDHGDSPILDPISSIFGPIYMPERARKSEPSAMQTRFLRERQAFVVDSSWRCI